MCGRKYDDDLSDKEYVWKRHFAFAQVYISGFLQ